MQGQSTPQNLSLLRTLSNLRFLAVAGQAAAILAAEHALELALPSAPLWAGCAVLAIAALFGAWRAHAAAAPTTGEVLGWLALDIGVLTWQLFWSGGPANPFVSMYLLPVVLVAFALPARWVLVVAATGALAYGLLVLQHQPLPHTHHSEQELIDLHLLGMWVNFLLSALVVTLFATRLASGMAAQRAKLAAANEAALRSQAVIAVATQAAATAHQLNTPLATMAVISGELADALADRPALAYDIALLRRQIDLCRATLRRLVDDAGSHGTAPRRLGQLVAHSIERLCLLRPGAAIRPRIGADASRLEIASPAAIEHLLLNLLSNALDASSTRASRSVMLDVDADRLALRLEVADQGAGPPPDPPDFASTKPHGLGLGLTLSRVIVAQHGGVIRFASGDRGGRVSVEFPLSQVAA